MFHTLDELRDRENERRNRSNTNAGAKSGESGILKEKSQNKSEPLDNNEKFERTKQKVRLAVYKNGFILNDEKFRDKSIPENKKFLDEVEKGQIPQELLKKGFTDLGILLINHRNEIYDPYQQINYLDLFNLPINHRTELYQYPQNVQYYYPQMQYPVDSGINYFYPVDNYGLTQNSDFNNYPKICYTEKRVKKINQKIQTKLNNNDEVKDNSKKENKKEIKKEIKKETKNEIQTDNRAKSSDKTNEKFKAFSGKGRQVGHVNLNGLSNLQGDKCATPNINRMYPTCKISVRLFNGEVVSTEFNLWHTLRDIYFYVRTVSGYNNFSLLEGFPPTPLRDYDRSIADLKLQNTILTQRIY